jgi:hypothetical protein
VAWIREGRVGWRSASALAVPVVLVFAVPASAAHCDCGASWFLFVDGDPDELEIECLACARQSSTCAISASIIRPAKMSSLTSCP